MSESLWIDIEIGLYHFHMLNLDHPDIEAAILSEIGSGVDVYYDRRWEITEVFCHFLVANPAWIANRSVLIIGTGIGLESLIIGRLCKKVHLNDVAPIALDLCARQLSKNNIHHYELMPGLYEAIDYPTVDIVIGCYLVYNANSARTMRRFLHRCSDPVLLMNDGSPVFRNLVKKCQKNAHCLFEENGFTCILFESTHDLRTDL